MNSVRSVSREPGILDVIAEIEKTQPQVADETAGTGHENVTDPIQLRHSLEEKGRLLRLLSGYADQKDLGKMNHEIEQALRDLDTIIQQTA